MAEDSPPPRWTNHAGIAQAPHAAALGLALVEAGEGGGVMKVAYRDDLVGDPETGVLAGGVITALLDHACGLAVGAAVMKTGALERGSMATLDLRIDYMRPARPRRDVLAHAHCYKLTHVIAFVRAVAFEDSPDDPIATAQAAFVLSGAAPRPGSPAP